MIDYKNTPHDSSHSHVSGESEFIDDRSFRRDELHVGVFFSPVASGQITQLDLKSALDGDGIVGIYTYKDLHGNSWGSIIQDAPMLAESRVNYVGEPIAIVAGETLAAVELAKRLIAIEIAEEQPILSIGQAIKQESFLGPIRVIECGDVDQALNKTSKKLSGRIVLGGQDQFYLESQASVAYPGEGDSIEVHSSSQHPTEVQHLVAKFLGLQLHQVVCVVKRMGGAFGGKESQAAPFAVMAALVAKKTGRAARLILTKDDDMKITGGRNPFEISYDVGFNDEGKIEALRAELFSDAGAYADLSTAIMERALLHMDNAYHIANARFTGKICRTHRAPTTAFRGFGGPKGVAAIESIIEAIAKKVGIDALEVRKKNLYRGDKTETPYGQVFENNVLPELFSKLEQSSEYQKRRVNIAKFNEISNDQIRGLSMTAVKFGISFTTRFLNQGNALVNVHTDGTIQVSTGATEMGQGVNTKIAGIVAECFGINAGDVRVMTTSTEKNHNTSATAASSGVDINGAAALAACDKIKNRLAALAAQVFSDPVGHQPSSEREYQPETDLSVAEIKFVDGQITDEKRGRKTSFADLVQLAYLHRIGLGDYAYYKIPGVDFDREAGKGNPFLYFTQGVAVSEVSIDRFTGELKVLRADILMDLGRRLNEGIDYGQTVGAFVQGMGWVTTENLFLDAKGVLKSFSPSTYKIPSIQDVPRVFNVDFIENHGSTKSLKGSKAVGEPPLLLGISVWTAVKNALSYLPGEADDICLPATQEEILMSILRADANG